MLLEIKNLTKSYRAPDGGDAVEVLHNIDWQLNAGESVAILGPSGSGKSTLLNIIGALDKADSGAVTVDGHDIEQFDERALAGYRNETVGFIFQLHHLLPQCTILENVLVPTLARTGVDRVVLKKRAEELLDSVGLKHRLHHRPGQLSGGERQRVAVARALINGPKLLLADEPTGALDRTSAGRLVDLLAELNQAQGVTLIVVTHALEVASRMQRVFEIKDCKLVQRP
ncbi:MAG: lolD 1 [Chthoniobacteraceae bacterium]|nr:lolD 1 [Chthoniobacteraceae bacterium]